MSRFLFEYPFEGAEWGFEIEASSPEDARDRLKALAWARYKGEVMATVPVPGGGLLRRIYDALRTNR